MNLQKIKITVWPFAIVLIFIWLFGCQNTAVEMSDSQILYSAKCSSCHNLIPPDRHDRPTWSEYIDKYGQKLTAQEKDELLLYLAGSN